MSVPSADSRAMARTLSLLRDRPQAPRVDAGVLDVLGDVDDPPARGIQALWVSRLGSAVYRRAQAQLREYVAISRPQLDALRAGAGDAVLDLGCGPGDVTARIGQRVGPRGLAVGLDVSRPMLSMAARRRPDNLAFVRADGTDLPFADGTFDAVHSAFVLQLVGDPAAMFAEIVRVLRPGGRCSVLAAGPDSPRAFDVFAKLGRVTFHSAAELSELAADAGLTEVRGLALEIAQAVSGTKPGADQRAGTTR